MALRVLLADESTTIRKVFQLTLQDYAVEVKSVHVGVDVIPVTESFEPDIIFADVLLQKKTGYDVCSELKAHDHLSNIPVVLMWSSFMELDEDKFQASGANDHLEKPFDVDKLRNIIHNLVPKTKDSPVSRYLEFPKMPEFEESSQPSTPSLELEEPAFSPTPPEVTPSFGGPDGLSLSDSITSSETTDMSEFREVQLSAEPDIEVQDSAPAFELFSPDEDEDEGWVRQTLPKFRVDENQDLNNPEDMPVDELVDANSIQSHRAATNEGPASLNLTEVPGLPQDPTEKQEPVHNIDLEEVSLDSEADSEMILESNDTQLNKAAQGKLSEEPSIEALDEVQLEKVIRAQSREVIESVVWKVVPEIATEMIEREIKRLLSEVEPRA